MDRDDDNDETVSTTTPPDVSSRTIKTPATPAYRTCRSPTRGRHLVAGRRLVQRELILCERPLLAVPSLDGLATSAVCHYCKAFVGGPDRALDWRFSYETKETTTTTTTPSTVRRRQDETTDSHSPQPPVESSVSSTKIRPDDDDDDPYRVISCRHHCGHLFCSVACERAAWSWHHFALCTGQVVETTSVTTTTTTPTKGDTTDVVLNHHHPLVRFKQLAAHSNEILLLVAEWWVAEHVFLEQKREHQQQQWADAFDTSHTEVGCPYTDFTMEPWWDVVAEEALATSLKDLCEQAAVLLSQTFEWLGTMEQVDLDGIQTTARPRIPPITAMDVARRVGSCEQNAMGIRQRHPLCRDVFDLDFRQRQHNRVIQCLEQAGFIGTNGGGSDDGDDGSACNDTDCCDPNNERTTSDDNTEQHEWDYSVDEIALFLSNLFMDEDGSVRDDSAAAPERDTVGDDLDYIFPPLDGTAMYSTTCKMNHSCDPNVIVLYKPTGWGSRHPLTAFCVALKNIEPGEELTISYIDLVDQSVRERQAALMNYGFTCQCVKCCTSELCVVIGPAYNSSDDPNMVQVETTSQEGSINLRNSVDDNDDDDASSSSAPYPQNTSSDDDELVLSQCEDMSKCERKLQKRLWRLDSIVNCWKQGSLSPKVVVDVSSLVVQLANANAKKIENTVVAKLLRQCSSAVQEERDFCMMKTVGRDLEATLYFIQLKHGSWPDDECYKKAFWCATLVAALAYSNECNFLNALAILEHGATLLGHDSESYLDDERLRGFFAYVRTHAMSMCEGPVSLSTLTS
jgi:hypothetical protein